MAQDIRKMLKDYVDASAKLSKDHEARFEERLVAAFAEEKPTAVFFWQSELYYLGWCFLAISSCLILLE